MLLRQDQPTDSDAVLQEARLSSYTHYLLVVSGKSRHAAMKVPQRRHNHRSARAHADPKVLALHIRLSLPDFGFPYRLVL